MERQTLNVEEMNAVVQIIDIACERGAFRGAEMAGIGSLRNKLEGMVREFAQAKQQAAEQPKVEEETDNG